MEQNEVIRQNSIKVSRNAKGDFSWEIKIYEDDNDAMNVKLADSIKMVKERIAKELEEVA